MAEARGRRFLPSLHLQKEGSLGAPRKAQGGEVPAHFLVTTLKTSDNERSLSQAGEEHYCRDAEERLVESKPGGLKPQLARSPYPVSDHPLKKSTARKGPIGSDKSAASSARPEWNLFPEAPPSHGRDKNARLGCPFLALVTVSDSPPSRLGSA